MNEEIIVNYNKEVVPIGVGIFDEEIVIHLEADSVVKVQKKIVDKGNSLVIIKLYFIKVLKENEGILN